MAPTPARGDAATPADERGSAELSKLVAQCVDRWEDEGPSVLEALCQAHPTLAAELRSRISRLGEAGLLGEASDDGRLPERVAGFRILALLGRGAMGVVYLAEQEELHRRVALKLVRPELLFFPGARERFRREVQAVARLAHPGIVPVFAGGEDRGLPWFAMEYVRGATLQDVLDELQDRQPADLAGADLLGAVTTITRRHAEPGPSVVAPGEAAARLSAGTWSAACLRVGRAVAEALAHAHAQGVLHRDIKPGNVMLTPDGRVLLLDFGLAAAEGSARLTSSGAQLGSLAWMSPEQLRGEREAIDARSDVYSLGVTLAELLTLRPPFAGGGVEATLARVLAGRAAPIRELNASVPRDAETVLQTAMDREPARRYATAADFAADLGNVLELRPIAARRPGALLRARRWAQRRPAAATGLVLGTLLVVGGPLLWGLMQARAARVERGLNEQLGAALERSDRDFHAALDAIDHVLRETAVDDLEDVPRMQKVRLSSIDRALELFPALQAGHADDPRVLSELAGLREGRGDVLRDLGQPEAGLKEFEQAIELRRRLVQLEPSAARQAELASALNDAGKAHQAVYHSAESLPFYAEAVTVLHAALAAEPDAPQRLRMLAVILANQAESRRSLRDDAGADADLREALQQLERALQLQPGDAELSWTEGRLAGDMGTSLRSRGQPSEGLDWCERSLTAFRAAHAAAPEHRYFAFDVSSGLQDCALCEQDLRRFDAARGRLEEARALLDDLVRDYPDAQRYRFRRIDILDALAVTAGLNGDHAHAAEILEAALVDEELLSAASPDRCDLQALACKSQINLANTFVQRVQELDRARSLLATAVERLRRCESQGALPASDAAMLPVALYLAALLECEDGKLDAAAPAITSYATSTPSDANFERRCADLWNEWVLALRRTEPDGAARATRESDGRAKFMSHLTRAVELGYADVDELRSTKSLDAFRQDKDFVALMARVEKRTNP